MEAQATITLGDIMQHVIQTLRATDSEQYFDAARYFPTAMSYEVSTYTQFELLYDRFLPLIQQILGERKWIVLKNKTPVVKAIVYSLFQSLT